MRRGFLLIYAIGLSGCAMGRRLEIRPPEVILATAYNADADQAYRHHFFEHNRKNIHVSRDLILRLYKDTHSGSYQSGSAAFEAAFNRVEQRLLDSRMELDGNSVPPQFGPPHFKLDSSYIHFLKCLGEIRKWYYTPIQRGDGGRAELTEGWSDSLSGEREIERIIAPRTTVP